MLPFRGLGKGQGHRCSFSEQVQSNVVERATSVWLEGQHKPGGGCPRSQEQVPAQACLAASRLNIAASEQGVDPPPADWPKGPARSAVPGPAPSGLLLSLWRPEEHTC